MAAVDKRKPTPAARGPARPPAPAIPPTIAIDRDTLAAVLGVEIRSITNFAAEGMPRASRGTYVLADCVRWYLKREVDAAKATRSLNDLDLARQRKTVAEAESAEFELAEKRGALLPLEVHEARLRERLEAVAGAIKANGRYHADVKAAITDEQADALLERMADEQLAELFELQDTIT